jgi:uncharacterized protein YdhG (YjbR/CyaY superfamily)
MNQVCPKSHALHWDNEKASGSTVHNIVWKVCCKKGAVQLEALEPLPPLFHHLFTSLTSDAKDFRKQSRGYNSALAFTSIKYKKDNCLQNQQGLTHFQIHGELFHLQGPLEAVHRMSAQFAQLYFYDPAEATAIRARYNTDLNPLLLRRLHEELVQVNQLFSR